MDLLEALRTNPSVREFTDEPVSDADVAAILDDARFAPSGGNRQPWRVAVVKDPALRRALADVCGPVWSEYLAIGATGATPFAVAGPQPLVDDIGPQPNPLLDAIEQVPVVLVVAADLTAIAMMDKDLERPTLSGGASIYPFVHSVLLAARDEAWGA